MNSIRRGNERSRQKSFNISSCRSLFDRGFCKERDIDDRRAGLGSGGIGGGAKKGKSCGTGRAQLLVNYISSDDDECFSTRDAFTWKSLARASGTFRYSMRLYTWNEHRLRPRRCFKYNLFCKYPCPRFSSPRDILKELNIP